MTLGRRLLSLGFCLALLSAAAVPAAAQALGSGKLPPDGLLCLGPTELKEVSIAGSSAGTLRWNLWMATNAAMTDSVLLHRTDGTSVSFSHKPPDKRFFQACVRNLDVTTSGFNLAYSGGSWGRARVPPGGVACVGPNLFVDPQLWRAVVFSGQADGNAVWNLWAGQAIVHQRIGASVGADILLETTDPTAFWSGCARNPAGAAAPIEVASLSVLLALR
jgi:hypothetical protein